jgi:hypothetical protein
MRFHTNTICILAFSLGLLERYKCNINITYTSTLTQLLSNKKFSSYAVLLFMISVPKYTQQCLKQTNPSRVFLEKTITSQR